MRTVELELTVEEWNAKHADAGVGRVSIPEFDRVGSNHPAEFNGLEECHVVALQDVVNKIKTARVGQEVTMKDKAKTEEAVETTASLDAANLGLETTEAAETDMVKYIEQADKVLADRTDELRACATNPEAVEAICNEILATVSQTVEADHGEEVAKAFIKAAKQEFQDVMVKLQGVATQSPSTDQQAEDAVASEQHEKTLGAGLQTMFKLAKRQRPEDLNEDDILHKAFGNIIKQSSGSFFRSGTTVEAVPAIIAA